MSEQQTAQAGATAEQKPTIAVADQPTAANPVQFEERRKAAIVNLCRANKLDERFEQHWINTGASLEKVADEMMAILAERSKNVQSAPALLGMSPKEVRRYSLLRALRASANKDWAHAGLELEAHKAIMNQSNRAPRGPTSFFVPLDVQSRDMTAAGVSGSNYLVSTDNLAGSFINLLANRSVVMTLGATRLSGLTGNLTIPRETAGATAYWLSDETTAITESQPTIGQLALSPKNVAALTEFTHQLMTQSSPQVEEFLMRVLARDIALAVDVGALRGSSSAGQPTGIVQTANIGTFTVDGTDTIGDLLDAQADVATANALTSSAAYVTTHAAAALLMKRQKFSSTDTPLWEGNVLDGKVLGFRAMATNQMSSGTMIFGDFSQLIIGEWGVLELMINPFSDFTRGYSQIRAWYTCDIGVRYPGAFSYAASVA